MNTRIKDSLGTEIKEGDFLDIKLQNGKIQTYEVVYFESSFYAREVKSGRFWLLFDITRQNECKVCN